MIRAPRDLFPITERWTYLNHAAISPLPSTAVERVAELARTVAATGDRRWPERNDECERVRRQAARLLGAREAHEVAFVGNTSEALSIVASGLDWRTGDNVVAPAPEFPSNAYPWMALEAFGVEHRRVPERPDGTVAVDDLLARVDGRTRALAVSWVQYSTGFRIDLAALAEACRERDVLLVVDAIQGLGGIAFDAVAFGVDVVAAAAHKWLLGPEGVALLHVSDRVVDRLRSRRHGWRSVADPFEWVDLDPTPAEGALRFEAGTLNALGIVALGASLDLLLDLGPRRVEERILALAGRLADGLEARGFTLAAPRSAASPGAPSPASGIVAATRESTDPAALVDGLEERGVVVSHRAGRLRVAPHVYTSEEDVERFLAGLDELL